VVFPPGGGFRGVLGPCFYLGSPGPKTRAIRAIRG
jgi:hypothetical protein